MPITLELLLTDDLPELPTLALLKMVERIERVQATENGLTGKEIQIALGVLRRYALNHNIELASVTASKEGFAALGGQIRAMGIETAVDQFASNRNKSGTFAILDNDEKKQILAKVEAIREIIEQSDLPTKKKNALFNKLNKFSGEVMKEGTDTDTLFAFTGELWLNTGTLEKYAVPALDNLKEILRIIFRNRSIREGIPLPSPDDVLKLPPPDEN
jgi:hypothetical protein